MAAATSTGISFSSWLERYLTTLSNDIDIDVYGGYIEGLLKDESLDKQEIIESIRGFLESVLPSESATEGSEAIFTRFHDSQVLLLCAVGSSHHSMCLGEITTMRSLTFPTPLCLLICIIALVQLESDVISEHLPSDSSIRPRASLFEEPLTTYPSIRRFIVQPLINPHLHMRIYKPAVDISLGSYLLYLLIFPLGGSCTATPHTHSPSPNAATSTTASEHFDHLEEQMRSILISTVVANTTTPTPSYANPFCPRNTSAKSTVQKTQGVKKQSRWKQRDACTVAVLRAAGVSGYQGGEEAEAALKVALADSEYFSKQAATGGVISPSVTTASKGGRAGLGADAVAATIVEREEIDLEEIEENQGYGRKEGIKPGSVMDALSTLNPGQFSSSEAAVAPAEDLKSTRHLKRMPTPGDVNSSSTPGYLLLNARSVSSSLGASTTTTTTPTSVGISPAFAAKKKSAPPSKHLADIGARAEEKHQRMMAKQRERLNAAGVGGASGNRLDDMDAFFISDDEDEVKVETKKPHQRKKEEDVLFADGGNRGRAIETQKLARVISAREYVERRAKGKAEQTNQLEENARKKVNAQQKTQKMERRRH